MPNIRLLAKLKSPEEIALFDEIESVKEELKEEVEEVEEKLEGLESNLSAVKNDIKSEMVFLQEKISLEIERKVPSLEQAIGNIEKIKGKDGKDGEIGEKPDHRWSGTAISFQKPNGEWGEWVDLMGLMGLTGEKGESIVGPQGEIGEKPEHQWVDTKLRFETKNGWGKLVDLRGERGKDGLSIIGPMPDHEWDGTRIRFERPDGEWGEWVELKGEKGKQSFYGGRGSFLAVQNNGTPADNLIETLNFVGFTTTSSGTSATVSTSVMTGIKTATFEEEYDNGNSGATATIDWNNGQKQKITLTANCTITFTAPPSVGNFLLKIVQDGTGSRTVTWPASVKWAGGVAPTLTTTATTGTDIVTFYYDGTNYYGVASLNFA